MKNSIYKFCGFGLICATVAFVYNNAYAIQTANPRGATVIDATGRTDVRVGRSVDQQTQRGNTTTRTGTTGTGHTVSNRRAKNIVSKVTTTASRSGTSRNAINSVASRKNATNVTGTLRSAASNTAVRSAISTPNTSRSGISALTTPGIARGRSATTPLNASRAAQARATAVFTDISKIGGAYAACRESYATCMDQFCANANDKYRRCFCSERFTEFRDMEDAIDQAKILLQNFENNNLNAVDKTAAEVNAMYSATAGEAAMKNDTSASANLLSEIGDLLSGKKKSTKKSSTSGTSMGVLSLDFSSDIGDIWSGGGFGNNGSAFSSSGVDLTTLEGKELYNKSNSQCVAMISDQCENDATLTMAKSAYSIMITQDCNAYAKKIDASKQTAMATVRQAEKMLRDARLEEYRNHNSQDVNDCLDQVRVALLSDTACGKGYYKCLDYSGAYVNISNGEPIYSPRLFQLEYMIKLDGGAEILSKNPEFNDFLEKRKMFATQALDACRDISKTVWDEFKRTAIIEIAQAQAAKVEEVRNNCVSTMRECYDKQSGALKDFDQTTSQQAGALAAYASKAMCKEKVVACAALYGNANGNTACNFDGAGHLIGGDEGASTCGLTALLNFVDSVDNSRAAEGCEVALNNYLEKLCTPTNGTDKYPWNCRSLDYGNGIDDNLASVTLDSISTKTLAGTVTKYAVENCFDPSSKDPQTFNNLPALTQQQARSALKNVYELLTEQLSEKCSELNGNWVNPTEYNHLKTTGGNPETLGAFYLALYSDHNATAERTSWGYCLSNSVAIACNKWNSDGDTVVAKYNPQTDSCEFTDEWYEQRCKSLGGYWENSTCYAPQN
ncbi:MAG: hypothetical protein MJ187_01265 [Alphaproteobacteria bacterium]|nr:hypothetical protein [Alphaproteobacteria bacterium]